MKKSIHTKLRRMANDLPVFKVRSKQPVRYSGEYLLSVNTFEVEGKSVEAEKSYLVYPIDDVNHYNAIKDVYAKEGMKGVEEYCDIIKEQFGHIVPA